jgi:HEAT repeat protein
VSETDKESDPAALAREYRATTDVDRRGELVEALWSLDTPAAVDTLRQLFLIEREVDVKVDILSGLSDSKKPETREGRFGLVVMALAPGQPKDLRELAAQMLVDFDDPRATGLLQQFTQDADPDMREAAQEALETRRAMEQP